MVLYMSEVEQWKIKNALTAGVKNKNRNLKESDGLYECCNCGKVVDTKADKAAAECGKKDKK